MSNNLVFSLTALLTLLPAALFPFRAIGGTEAQGRTVHFWGAMALAAVGPIVWSAVQVGARWQTGLAVALWVTVATCMVLFMMLSALTRSVWRLAPLLLPYLLVVAALATAATSGREPALHGGAPGIWIDVHIGVSVVTYALLTLSAMASLAAFLQDRALRAKRPTALTRFLPPMRDSDRLQVRLLGASEAVLGLGLITGMAVLHYEQGILLRPDHKTLFSFATFVVIGGLLFVHARTGIRGRTATRMILIAYLLLTLAYPGVKFVTDVLMT